ncbi:MAG: alpha/beta fold hydrolase [Cyanobacteria bacterium P01_C01_bin.72]
MKISASAPVWINANPSFKYFEGRIIRYLSQQVPLAYWEYHQELDEASSLKIALTLLHDYIKTKSQAIDIIGHGTGGLLGLLYARQYPNRVKSLTLLGVGSTPSSDWQAQYYQIRQLLPCSQEITLGRIVRMMFGPQSRSNTVNLTKVLQRDLVTAPTSHSLYQLDHVEPGGVSMPMMVCGSENDGIINRSSLDGWNEYLKSGDELWVNSQGHHFVHYFFPEVTGRQIIKFWRRVETQSTNISSKSNVSEEICCHYF